MSESWALGVAIAVATVAAMEAVAYLVHRYVMHGFGWGWHRSHHEPRDGALERNDLYAVVFAVLSMILFALGEAWPLLWWVGVGMAGYGIIYAIFHDGLVHRRIPLLPVPRSGYLKHLVQAHRLHHAVRERDGAVSFGFLYAPPLPRLKQQLKGRSATP